MKHEGENRSGDKDKIKITYTNKYKGKYGNKGRNGNVDNDEIQMKINIE